MCQGHHNEVQALQKFKKNVDLRIKFEILKKCVDNLRS